MPTHAEFVAAITDLFAFATLGTTHNIQITATEIGYYADIGVFLSDDDAVMGAMKTVADRMLQLFQLYPERFGHAEDSPFVLRNRGQIINQQGVLDSQEEARKTELARYATSGKKPPEKLTKTSGLGAAFSGLHNEMAQQAKTAPQAFSSDGKTVVRRFSFRKLLVAIEDELLGFDDSARIVLVDDDPIASKLRELKVWKDSIGIQHGEYTHRLQWLAIAIGCAFPRPVLQLLYRGASATIKKTVYECFGFASLKDFIASRATKDPAKDRFQVPVNVWEFLFDSLEVRGAPLPTWLERKGDVTLNKLQAYRYSHRSMSCRSPAYLNTRLRNNAGLGLIHAYLTASSIKLVAMSDNKEVSISKYRKDRIQQKQLLNAFQQLQFEPAFSTTSPQLTGLLGKQEDTGLS